MTEEKALQRELTRFAIVGGSAIAVDFLVYFAVLWSKPEANTWLAKGISFLAGGLLAFLAYRSYVFRSSGAIHRQLGPFAILYLVTLGLNTAVNQFALGRDMPTALAWLLATSVATVANFLGMKLIVFRREPA